MSLDPALTPDSELPLKRLIEISSLPSLEPLVKYEVGLVHLLCEHHERYNHLLVHLLLVDVTLHILVALAKLAFLLFEELSA